MGMTRRTLLRGAAAGVGLSATAGFSRAIELALAVTPPKRATLDDIEHVVILMQENRSFDHYFGTLRGVRGFADTDIIYNGSKPVWWQPDDDPANPDGYVLPFRLNTVTSSGQAVADQSHAWIAQQSSFANGRMNGFVNAHNIANGNPGVGFDTMGYYTRADIPFHYALADAFTICDEYHCSVFGPTNPNRVMSMSGTVNPEGGMGGPLVDDTQTNGVLHWTSYPEQLQTEGISWFIYQESDNDGNNMLPMFSGFNNAPKTSPLYLRGNSTIPTAAGQPFGPALWARLRSDVTADRLPQVSWVLASTNQCEHPSATPGQGAYFVSEVLAALASNPKVWSKTVLFYMFDENDGFFDHVPPPVAPAGTPGEWVSSGVALKNVAATFGDPGPVGLGFRVPMTVVSPFSRGGLVCNQVLDHTSHLQFLEAKFGVRCPNISEWRRNTVGDLTETLTCITPGVFNFASLPNGYQLAQQADSEAKLPAPTIPNPQTYPTQESGTRPVVGSVACAAPATQKAKKAKKPKKHPAKKPKSKKHTANRHR
jgi:phospholipase C